MTRASHYVRVLLNRTHRTAEAESADAPIGFRLFSTDVCMAGGPKGCRGDNGLMRYETEQNVKINDC